MLLLEQNSTRKGQVDKAITRLEFEADNREKYEIKGICDNMVYTKELEGHYPSSLYCLVL